MPSLVELLSGGLRQPHMSEYGGNPKLPTTLFDLINEKSAQPAFGMDANANRLSLLPRYSKQEGLVAPDVLYSLAQALSAPGQAARGVEQGPMAGINVGLAALGMGGAMPNVGGLGANAGMTKLGGINANAGMNKVIDLSSHQTPWFNELKEPPVSKGMTRLYRGGPADSNWFSSSPETAQFFFTNSSKPSKLSYVDVPTAQADEFYHAAANTGKSGAGESAHLVSDQFAKTAKVLAEYNPKSAKIVIK